jgi:hypothetical protein
VRNARVLPTVPPIPSRARFCLWVAFGLRTARHERTVCLRGASSSPSGRRRQRVRWLHSPRGCRRQRGRHGGGHGEAREGDEHPHAEIPLTERRRVRVKRSRRPPTIRVCPYEGCRSRLASRINVIFRRFPNDRAQIQGGAVGGVQTRPSTGHIEPSFNYKIVRLLPVQGADPLYRIKSVGEPFERVGSERELSRTG